MLKKKQVAQTFNKLVKGANEGFSNVLKKHYVELQGQKHWALQVHRHEKTFLRELRQKLRNRYDNLRESFIQTYEVQSLKSQNAMKSNLDTNPQSEMASVRDKKVAGDRAATSMLH